MTICTPDRPEPPPFSEPWHAQAFALTVHLSERGNYSWPEWAERFSAELAARRGQQGPLDGGADYWAAWLGALERLLSERGLAESAVVEALKEAWEAAYLATPHGEAVRLEAGQKAG